jgi:hypothetical protein
MAPDLIAGLAAEILGAAGVLLLGLVLALVAGRDSIDPPIPDRWVPQLVPHTGHQLAAPGPAPMYPGRYVLIGEWAA